MRLSEQQRTRIIQLRNGGLGYGTIQANLANDGIYTSRTSVKNVCNKYDETGDILDRKVDRKSKFGGEQAHKDYLDQTMEEQPDTTAKTLAKGIESNFGIEVSDQTAAKVRRKLGWTRKSTRYCQMIRAENKVKRLAWCNEQIASGETFDVSRLHFIIIITMLFIHDLINVTVIGLLAIKFGLLFNI